MSDLLFETERHLMPILRTGDLDTCEETVSKQIEALPRSPFDLVVESRITNDPADAAQHFDRFFGREIQRIAIAAAYTEMNGFYVNPRLWFCDVFAYTEYGGHDDYDWLSSWQSEDFPRYTIRGMESLQEVYASWHGKRSFHDAEDLCSLLVVIKFQKFVKATAAFLKQLRFPLLVTAHEFDFISQVNGSY